MAIDLSDGLGLDDILGAAMGMAGGQAQQQNPMGDILGGILGGMGGGAAQPQQQPSGMGGMGILGDILGGILGGGNSMGAMAQHGIMGSIVNGIAKKTGLPPMVIYMALTFIMGKLMSGAMNRQQQPRAPQQMPGGMGGQQRMPQGAPAGGGMDLDDILGRMQQGKGFDKNYINQSGMAEELAGQIGMNKEKSGDLIHTILDVLEHLPRR
jgi:hypothetical protein